MPVDKTAGRSLQYILYIRIVAVAADKSGAHRSGFNKHLSQSCMAKDVITGRKKIRRKFVHGWTGKTSHRYRLSYAPAGKVFQEIGSRKEVLRAKISTNQFLPTIQSDRG